MKFILAITTYNRIDYLKRLIKTWQNTKSNDVSWQLVVADDGSTDGTLNYLNSIDVTIIKNQRRGIHHQTNQLLKHCENLEFDLTFKTDDDVIFLQQGWDKLYYEAVKTTGFDHLVHNDHKWYRVWNPRIPPISDASGLLESHCYRDFAQGAFWTFTPRVLKTVGYVDIKHFGLCGFGHRDYTYRCCKAGFNKLDAIFDIKNSNEYVALIKKGYRSAPNRDKYYFLWNTQEMISQKIKNYCDNRCYIPYHALHVNVNKKAIMHKL